MNGSGLTRILLAIARRLGGGIACWRIGYDAGQPAAQRLERVHLLALFRLNLTQNVNLRRREHRLGASERVVRNRSTREDRRRWIAARDGSPPQRTIGQSRIRRSIGRGVENPQERLALAFLEWRGS